MGGKFSSPLRQDAGKIFPTDPRAMMTSVMENSLPTPPAERNVSFVLRGMMAKCVSTYDRRGCAARIATIVHTVGLVSLY